MVVRRRALERFILNPSFWRSKRVLITGHTGFKGSWLSLWLASLGAEVTGLALAPESERSLFEQADVGQDLLSLLGDVRDLARIRDAVTQGRPEIVFHLAAQSLVRRSYSDPAGTYQTNVVGTANVLQAVRDTDNDIKVVIVTSDKCYENVDTLRPYREDDRLGGRDPYSNSKACAELVAASYRDSFFEGRRIATARAGNVIGGCDWAEDRLIPDLVRAALKRSPALIRNPESVRPWQHVLDCLGGYLVLAEGMDDPTVASAWNFGPDSGDVRSVRSLVTKFAEAWPGGIEWTVEEGDGLPEARMLQLDSTKARTELEWRPRLDLDEAVAWTVEVYKASVDAPGLRDVIHDQLARYSTGSEGQR